MLAIPITVNLFLLVGSLAFAGLLGFAFRSGQIRSLKSKVTNLEKEMLTAHAEILELQGKKVGLEQKLKESSHIPVIPMRLLKKRMRKNT